MASNMNSEIQKLIPDLEGYQRKLENIASEVLDQRVAKTDMKLRHIVSKTIEVSWKCIYIFQNCHFQMGYQSLSQELLVLSKGAIWNGS